MIDYTQSRAHPVFLDTWCFCSAWAVKCTRKVLHVQTTFHWHIAWKEKTKGGFGPKCDGLLVSIIVRPYSAFGLQCEEVQSHTDVSPRTADWDPIPLERRMQQYCKGEGVFSCLLGYFTQLSAKIFFFNFSYFMLNKQPEVKHRERSDTTFVFYELPLLWAGYEVITLMDVAGKSSNLNCMSEVLGKITLKLSYSKKLSLLLIGIWKGFCKCRCQGVTIFQIKI